MYVKFEINLFIYINIKLYKLIILLKWVSVLKINFILFKSY